jgi:hypothetical protein
MRSGVLISIVSHIIFVALALLGTPKLFDEAATRPIEVELVRPEDAPPEEKPPEKPEDSKAAILEEPGKPEKDKPAPWNPLPDQTAASPKPDPATKLKDQQANAQAQQPQTQQPQGQGQSSQPQPSQPQASQPQVSQFAPQLTDPSIFDPVNIPKLLNLPNAPDSGFDSESMTAADITADQKAAFKAHLRKCWKLPSSVSSPTTRVVLRVYLRRDGKLGSEPVLIEASASREGPVVMQTAIRALKECQPYGFLPADKYSEWKVLDLSFTPRDMAGG